MNLLGKINSAFRVPTLTRPRMILALTVAVITDALQFILLPFAWTFAESAVDVVAMVLTTWILGFHLLLLPTFIVELVPIADALPTWTACVIAVIALRKRAQNSPPPPPTSPTTKPTIEI
jgi:hypothetical protein